MAARAMTEPSKRDSEEPFGLRPVAAGVTQPHLLQWVDPTFEAAEPSLQSWLDESDAERRAA